MNFSNPYPHTIHEVYPHTFLQMIAADVRFTSPHTSDEYWQKFRKFSEEIFKISVTEHPIAPDQYAEFSSEAAETVYSFKNDAALVAIGSKGYKSFGETMPEHFRTIQGFLQNVVPSSKVHTLTLGKKNRFPFHITLEHFEVKEALNYVFKAEHVEDMDRSALYLFQSGRSTETERTVARQFRWNRYSVQYGYRYLVCHSTRIGRSFREGRYSGRRPYYSGE